MISLNLSASPSGAGPSYSYAFQPISQGHAAVVTVSVPNAPPGASWSVYAGGQLVGTVVGPNGIGDIYLAGGTAVTVTGTAPSAPGDALMVGIEGSVSEVPVTSPTPSAGVVNVGAEVTVNGTVDVGTISGTVDANITNANLPVSGSVDANITNATLTVDGTVSLTAGQVVEVTNQAGGSLTVAGTVDANIQNATIDVTGSTVTLGPGPVSYVAIPNPSAGADWAYVLPQTLRLTSVRATLTTSATVAARNPELWQVVNGDTVPTQETILSYDSVLPSWSLVFSSSPGAAPNYRAQIAARPFGPADVGTTGITLVTVAANQYFTEPTLYAMQSGGTAAITLYVDLNGSNLGTVELGINGSAELPLPDLTAGDTITAFTSAGSAVVTVEGGLVNDDRRVSSFSGLLMPAGSLIESATGNLQPGDQWSDIQLAFTEQ